METLYAILIIVGLFSFNIFAGYMIAGYASKKGRSFGLWFIYGFFLWFIASIHCNFLSDKLPPLK